MRLKCTSEKEGAKEGGIYNSTVRGYYNRRLNDDMILLKITLDFAMDVPSSTRRPTTINTLVMTNLQ